MKGGRMKLLTDVFEGLKCLCWDLSSLIKHLSFQTEEVEVRSTDVWTAHEELMSQYYKAHLESLAQSINTEYYFGCTKNKEERKMTFIQAVNNLIAKAHAKYGVHSATANKAVYDILAALRGPDQEDSGYLKKVTTARLRSVIGLTEAPRVLVLNTSPVGPDTVKAEMEVADSHFSENFQRAANAVNGLYGVNLMDDGISVPDLVVGKTYTLKTKKYPEGRKGMVVVSSIIEDTDEENYNIISAHDGRPFFKCEYESLEALAEALGEASWLVSIS
jgi:hypothetical protein